MQAEEIAKAFEGPAFDIFKHTQRMADSYALLTNALTADDAKAALRDFKAAAADGEKLIRTALYAQGVPAALIINVNKEADRLWTFDKLSGLQVSLMHYLARFIHSKKPENKVKELTTIYFLVKDLAECSLTIDPEKYRRD